MSETGYVPDRPTALGPLYQKPVKLRAVLKWLFGVPGYFIPHQVSYLGIAALSWFFLTPDRTQMKELSLDWVGLILLRNAVILAVVMSLWHGWLYVRKAQGTRYKYDSNWLAVNDSTFLFRNQLWDNIFWAMCSAVPIWTLYEVSAYWLYANGYLWSPDWAAHPLYLALQIVLLLTWLSSHFYFTHRMLHWEPLYNSVHSLHHKNVNFGPWSGLAMHPVEHLVYFSGVLLFWIIPSHPFMTLYTLMFYALGTIPAHHGFDRIALGKDKYMPAGHYQHYLHHKYTRVNYNNDVSVLPLDKWFGTFHDGSAEAHEAMKRRARERILRSRPKAGAH